MAYSEFLADRIRQVFKEKKVHFEEKKMMGGLCFLVDSKMCAGVVAESLMARIGPEMHASTLGKSGCREMDFTGRAMKGYVFVDPEGIDKDLELAEWLQMCLDFNPAAKASKKRGGNGN